MSFGLLGLRRIHGLGGLDNKFGVALERMLAWLDGRCPMLQPVGGVLGDGAGPPCDEAARRGGLLGSALLRSQLRRGDEALYVG